MMHIIPEQISDFVQYQELLRIDSRLPIPLLAVCVGYIIMLIIDKVLVDTDSQFHDEI